MLIRVLIVVAVIGLAGGLALAWHRREGRFTEATGRFTRGELGLARGTKPSALIVEFFGQDCAPCTVVQKRLEAIAEHLPDVQIVQVDAGERMDLSDRYGVRRVPTLFVADQDLKIIWRASGVPTEDAIMGALLGPDWAGRPHPEDATVEQNH